MRVLILGSYAPSLINFRGELIATIEAAGHDVHVGAPDLFKQADLVAELRGRGATAHDVNLSRTGLNPLKDIASLVSYAKLFNRVKPDILLAYTIKPIVYGLTIARLMGIETRYALITGLGYAFSEDDVGQGLKAKLKQLIRGLYRFALKDAATVIFQNRDDQALFFDRGLIAQGARTAIVNGSGVDLTRFPPCPEPEPPISVLMIARLLKAKGVDEYITAATSVKATRPDAKFHLVGGADPGPDSISEDKLKELSNENSAIQWHGDQPDVRPYLRDCHIYVLPSYREGTPRSVLEAMATGRAIITTDVPGCRETVEHMHNGFLVPVQESASLAEAIRSLVDNDGLRREFAAASLKLARTKYDVKKVNETMLRIMGLD